MMTKGTYVVPTHGKTPGRIDEAGRVGIETTGDGVHNSEFTESVDCKSCQFCLRAQNKCDLYIPTLKIIIPMIEKSMRSVAGP